MNHTNDNDSAVLGQKYAFATAALLLGVASYISLLGLEKAILAIIFAWLALKTAPAPTLKLRRGWGKAGAALGVAHIVLVVTMLALGWNAVTAVLQYASEAVAVVTQGPKVALQVHSPDQAFTAYAEEMPSIDPPNQSLWVERSGRREFMHIADLAEDVDSIRSIVWSPDSRIVVFQSRDYLTATRVKDWQTVRIYLGREWTRHQSSRRSTFSSGGEGWVVDAIEFPATDCFTYRLKGQDQMRTIRFGELLPPPLKKA